MTTIDSPTITCPSWCQAEHATPADPGRVTSRLHCSGNHIALSGSAMVLQWTEEGGTEPPAVEVTAPDFMSLEQAEDFAEMILDLVREVRRSS